MTDKSKMVIPDVHSLTLKVLRLCRPSLVSSPSLMLEEEEQVRPSTPAPRTSDMMDFEGSGTSSMLVLPSSFGKIYVGETFSAYINLLNHTGLNLRQVILKAELQVGASKIMLVDNSTSPYDSFGPNKNQDFVVSHRLSEAGNHILACTVYYVNPGQLEQHKSFRKFFKFNAFHPISISTKVMQVQSSFFVESEIQNTSSSCLFLESVLFGPADDLTIKDLNQSDPNNHSNQSTFGDKKYFKPSEVRHYLHILDSVHADSVSQSQRSLGRVEVSWRSNMGEPGRVQTQQVVAQVVPSRDIEVYVPSLPPHLELEVPFRLSCNVRNRTSSAMNLRLVLLKAKMSGVLVNGVSTQDLGQIPAHGSIEVLLTLLPLAPGVHPVTGLKFVNMQTNMEIEVDKICDVLVE
eukprot:GILJ01004292.1.p1 GENE.GILJ01004292.1~~GILJ01004292.1.p1  ORF type:complete len:405 (-),score=65.28 GILJ01004292.1:250-1464(-)